MLPQLFVHEGQGVIARGQALNFELAVRPSDRVERIFHDVDEHSHPRVLVAFHRQHDFFTGEALFQGRGFRGLGLIPFAVVLGSGMNVVRCGIVVDNLDGLTGHHAQYVGMISAAALR